MNKNDQGNPDNPMWRRVESAIKNQENKLRGWLGKRGIDGCDRDDIIQDTLLRSFGRCRIQTEVAACVLMSSDRPLTQQVGAKTEAWFGCASSKPKRIFVAENKHKPLRGMSASWLPDCQKNVLTLWHSLQSDSTLWSSLCSSLVTLMAALDTNLPPK